MEYLVGDKKVRYNPYHMKKDIKLGEGKEGEVYLVKDKAIKFYKPYCQKKRLTKEEVVFLSAILTKRILMPADIILNKRRQLEGYSTLYIENLGLSNLLELQSSILKEEFSILKEDVVLLSDYLVLLEDLLLENISFHQGIYVVDPGSFTFSELDVAEVYGLNMEVVNEFLILQLLATAAFYLTKKRELSRKVTQSIFHDYQVKEYPDLIEYLIDDIQEENLKEYIKVKSM